MFLTFKIKLSTVLKEEELEFSLKGHIRNERDELGHKLVACNGRVSERGSKKGELGRFNIIKAEKRAMR